MLFPPPGSSLAQGSRSGDQPETVRVGRLTPRGIPGPPHAVICPQGMDRVIAEGVEQGRVSSRQFRQGVAPGTSSMR